MGGGLKDLSSTCGLVKFGKDMLNSQADALLLSSAF